MGNIIAFLIFGSWILLGLIIIAMVVMSYKDAVRQIKEKYKVDVRNPQ
jgi:hypothetical protein